MDFFLKIYYFIYYRDEYLKNYQFIILSGHDKNGINSKPVV